MENKAKVGLAVGVAAVGAGIVWLLSKKAVPPIPPENIVLSDLVIEPTEVYVGEEVSISVLATNMSSITGQATIECEII